MDTVTIHVKCNGRKLPPNSGFPYRHFVQELVLPMDEAESLIDDIRAKAKAAAAAKVPSVINTANVADTFDAFAATDEERAAHAAKRK